jgi:spermidine synthase
MADSDKTCLFRQYESGTLIEVWQQQDKRQLLFDNKVIQSEMLLSQPEHLVLPIHQLMMAGCLFTELPNNVLLAGVGGASIARYFAHHFPAVEGDAVELSTAVCGLVRNLFQFPEMGWQLHHQDIRGFIEQAQKQYDLIVFDIAEGMSSPDWLLHIPFLQQLKQRLSPTGHCVFNILTTNPREAMTFLAAIRIAFAQQTICLRVPNYSNMLVFAFQEKPIITAEQIENRIADYQHFWQLDFETFWRLFLKDNPEGSGLL